MTSTKRFLPPAPLARRKGLRWTGFLAMAGAAGVGYGRLGRADGSPKPKPVPAPVPVGAVCPRREALHRDIEQPGQIDGFERTPLYSKIPGFVRSYHFDI